MSLTIVLYFVFVTISCVAQFFNTQEIFNYFLQSAVQSLFQSQSLTELSILNSLARKINVMHSQFCSYCESFIYNYQLGGQQMF